MSDDEATNQLRTHFSISCVHCKSADVSIVSSGAVGESDGNLSVSIERGNCGTTVVLYEWLGEDY